MVCLWHACTGGTPAYAASPPVGTAITNRATVAYHDANGNLLPEASATVSTIVSGAPVLAVTKTASADIVSAGDLLTYTITCENRGNADALSTVVVDHLPAEVIFLSASTGGAYSSGPPAGGSVAWNPGTLAAGERISLWVEVRVKAGLAVGTMIDNTADITSAEGASAAAAQSARVGFAPNLSITKSAVQGTVTPGGTITYTIDYKNSGNQTASFVSIGDTLPAGTTYVDGSSTADVTVKGGLLSWSIGSIPAGVQGSVTFQVTISPAASEGDMVRNTAALTSKEGGTISSNTVATAVVASPPLIVAKTGVPDPVRAGDTITYTIVVTNGASTPVTGLLITDPLPAHTAFVSADAGGVLSGDSVVWSAGTLAGGASTTVRLVVQALPFSDPNPVIANRVSAAANEALLQTASTTTSVICRTPAAIRFLDAASTPTNRYSVGDMICMEVSDPDQNRDPLTAETVTVRITTSGTGDAETIILTETDINTGVFHSCLPSDTGPTVQQNGILTVASDITVTVAYEDPLDALCGYQAESTADVLIDPFGVVFNSITGLPVADATVTLIDDATGLAAALPLNPKTGAVQPNPVVTKADGAFQFEYVSPGTYHFTVGTPAGYLWPSAVPNTELRLSWPAFVIDDNGSKGESFTLTAASPPLNIDLPLDPPGGSFVVEKTADKSAASVGDLVQYTVTVSNNGASPIGSIAVHDAMPHGVRYLNGSSRLGGVKIADPVPTAGRTVIWNIPALAPGDAAAITFRALVGPDSHRGTGRNTAWASGTTVGAAVSSSIATHDLKITEGVFTSRAIIIGKVFIDSDGNGLQTNDAVSAETTSGGGATEQCHNEPGIPGVVLYLEDGTRVITDQHGKFSIPGVAPGTHVLRVDTSSLPEGVELTASSGRSMGDGTSQFISIGYGSLFKANFTARMREGTDFTALRIQKQTILKPDRPTGASGRSGAPASITQAPEPVETGTVLTDTPAAAGAKAVHSEESPAPHTTPPLEERILTMSKELAFVSPVDGAIIAGDSTAVVIKAPAGSTPALSVNGRTIGNDKIG